MPSRDLTDVILVSANDLMKVFFGGRYLFIKVMKVSIDESCLLVKVFY